MMYLIINFVLLLVAESVSYDLPSYFSRCGIADPDLNNCIVRAGNSVRPHIKKGIKEIKFPPLDPLIISRLEFSQESNLVNYTGSARNYSIWGLDTYDLTYRYNPNTMVFDGSIGFDSLTFHTNYILNGRFLSIPINGAGIARVVFAPVNGTFKIRGKMAKRKGTEFYKPIKTTIRFLIGDGSYDFGGLFNGDETLGHLTNDMINQNSKAITDALTPAFEKFSEKGLMLIIKSLTGIVAYEELFPLPQK